MKLSVPFILDKSYVHFLITQQSALASVYFSLQQSPVLDARIPATQASLEQLINGLNQLGPVKKYLLLNTRFIHPDRYFDPVFLNRILAVLETLQAQTGLTGIVFSDAYFLNALSNGQPKVISLLEAIPGINCMIDSIPKALSFLTLIESSGFRPPGKLILDRSLNRDFNTLTQIKGQLQKRDSSVTIELMANEGCLLQCPFKLAHDAHISYSNLNPGMESTLKINRSFGCHHWFYTHPQTVLASPFIRPEDVGAYDSIADTLKLCGRTLGPGFLIRCIQAFIHQSYTGNLLDLLDATHWLSDLYHIDNAKLGPDFLNTLAHCTKDCRHCKICETFFSTVAVKTPIGLKNYKDYL